MGGSRRLGRLFTAAQHPINILAINNRVESTVWIPLENSKLVPSQASPSAPPASSRSASRLLFIFTGNKSSRIIELCSYRLWSINISKESSPIMQMCMNRSQLKDHPDLKTVNQFDYLFIILFNFDDLD